MPTKSVTLTAAQMRATAKALKERAPSIVSADGPDDALKTGHGVLDQAAAEKLARKAELPGMPARPILPTQDGLPFPTAKIALTGGVELILVNQAQIDKAEAFHLEDEVDVRIHGEVASKQWKVGQDKDGDPIRILTIGIKVTAIPELTTDRFGQE